MRIYQPENEEEGLSTSFTFDDKEEQSSFVDWLNSLGIGFLKARIPFLNDGVLTRQECVIINVPVEEVEEEVEEQHEEKDTNEETQEPKPKKNKKKKNEDQ